MKQVFKNINTTLPQRHSCLFLLLLFFCLTIAMPVSSLNLLVEKSVEKEVEENKKEKEEIEENSDGEVSIIAKAKKSKKISDKDVETSFPQLAVSTLKNKWFYTFLYVSATLNVQKSKFSQNFLQKPLLNEYNIVFSPFPYQITFIGVPKTQYIRFSAVPFYIAYHRLVFYEI